MSEASGGRFAVIHCGQLVTLAGPACARRGAAAMRELGIVKDGAMIVAGSRIEQTGTTDGLRQVIHSGQLPVIDAKFAAVTPGFIDAHTHLPFAGSRAVEFEQRIGGATYQQIAASGGGILRTVEATRAASFESLLERARRHAMWMLRTGTTTAEAKSGYGLSLETELKILRVLRTLQTESPLRIIPTLLAAHTVPPEFRGNRSAYVSLIVSGILPAAVRESLAEFCDVFCDEHAFTLEESRTILQAAQRAGLGLRIHVEQFVADGGAELAASLHADSADHLEATEAAGMDALAAAGVQPVLVPASVYCLGRDRYANARAMIDAGLGVVLATDFNPGSSPTTSMPFVLSLACQRMKMLPAEALTAATINAAYSLRRGATLGSLEAGKTADFLIHEFEDYRELAYFAAVPNVPQVFIGGRRIPTSLEMEQQKQIPCGNDIPEDTVKADFLEK
jgi:imidazolonepropionase